MTTPQLHRLNQRSSQSPTSPTVGQMPAEWHAPGGTDLMWNNPGHGLPPMSSLSDAGVACIEHNPFTQIPGRKMECLIVERPDYFIEKLGEMYVKHAGPLLLNTGSPAYAVGWDHGATMQKLDQLLWRRNGAKLPTTIIFDAWGEATGEGLARNIQMAMSCIDRGWLVGIEGIQYTKYAGIVPWSCQLLMRSQLRRMVNDAKQREGVAPLMDQCIVWVDDPKDGSVQASVDAAKSVMTYGVVPDPVTTPAAPDAFQLSAMGPKSAAVSCTQNAQDVQNTWPKSSPFTTGYVGTNT